MLWFVLVCVTSWIVFCRNGRSTNSHERNTKLVTTDAIMRVLNCTKLTDERIAALRSLIPDQENLQDLMDWALATPPGTFTPQVVADVVIQDEFTHDVLVPWREGLVLAYDTT